MSGYPPVIPVPQDSACTTFTSCSCGILNTPQPNQSPNVRYADVGLNEDSQRRKRSTKHDSRKSKSKKNKDNHEPYNSKSENISKRKYKKHSKNKKTKHKEFFIRKHERDEPTLNRILNGEDVADNKYPWQALVFNRLEGSRGPGDSWYRDIAPDGQKYDICSGALVTNQHVLTDGPCVETTNKDNNEADNVFVKLGDTNKGYGNGGTFSGVSEIIVHRNVFSRDASPYQVLKMEEHHHQVYKLGMTTS